MILFAVYFAFSFFASIGSMRDVEATEGFGSIANSQGGKELSMQGSNKRDVGVCDQLADTSCVTPICVCATGASAAEETTSYYAKWSTPWHFWTGVPNLKWQYICTDSVNELEYYLPYYEIEAASQIYLSSLFCDKGGVCNGGNTTTMGYLGAETSFSETLSDRSCEANVGVPESKQRALKANNTGMFYFAHVTIWQRGNVDLLCYLKNTKGYPLSIVDIGKLVTDSLCHYFPEGDYCECTYQH